MKEKNLLNELDEIIYVSDPITYEILYLNNAGKKAMGIKNYSGQKCYKLLQGKDRPCEFCTNNIINSDEFYTWEYTNSYVNKHFILRDKIINWDGNEARLEIAIDITEKENISRNIQEKLNIESTIIKCIQSLLVEKDINKSIYTIIGSIGEFYQADRCYMIEMDNNKMNIKNIYEWCSKESKSKIDFINKMDVLNLKRWIQNLIAIDFDIDKNSYCYIAIENAKNFYNESLLNSISYFIVNEVVKRKAQNRLEEAVSTNKLTGLKNHYSYRKYLDGFNGNDISSIGVIFLNINGVKQVNEKYGHEVGDRIIKQVALILKEYYKKKCMYHLNGDEFIIVWQDVAYDRFICSIDEIKNRFKTLEVATVSLGYTWADRDLDINLLVKHAEDFMYINKQEYYKNTRSINKHQNSKILESVLKSIENKEFKMYLQPKSDVKTGEIIGAEALIRHIHPEHGIISPGRFIPILEEEKIIKYVDLFIFEEVCKTLDKWNRIGYQLMTISLNFSRITLMEEDLVNTILNIKDKYNFPLNLIEIEVTESVGEIERELLEDICLDLRSIGFRISLDDFGTQYTSMSILTMIDIDILKLDRSLVRDLVESNKSRILIKHIIDICKDMNINIVAEGVETKEQLGILRELNCDYIQGYLLSKPIPLNKFEDIYQWKEE